MYLPKSLELFFYLLIIYIFHIQKDKLCRPVMDRHSFFCFTLLNRISGDPIIFLPVVLNLFKIFNPKIQPDSPHFPAEMHLSGYPSFHPLRFVLDRSFPDQEIHKILSAVRCAGTALFSNSGNPVDVAFVLLILLINNIDFLSVSR